MAFGPRLGKITVPTLIIGGDEDKGAPPEVLAAAAAAISDCRHVVIEKAGHIANIENPAAVNAALLEFMDELTVSA